MFEKEAEEAGNDKIKENHQFARCARKSYKDGFKDGAEFGYNKAKDENAELKEQIEKMKCCENCRYYSRTYEHCYSYESYQSCTSLSNWRLKE